VEEKLKSALSDAIHSKIENLNQQKEQILTKGKHLEKLTDLVATLEKGFERLKDYSRDSLEEILEPYYPGNLLNEELNKLDIVRFVLEIKDRGYDVELNEEEIDIMVNFLDKIKIERNVEHQKYEKMALINKEQLEAEIKLLLQIEEKVSLGNKGTKIIIGREIDKIMQLAIEEEADEDVQISILSLLNKMNLGISANVDKETA